MLSDQEFLSYFHEQGASGSRSERFFDDISHIVNSPFVTPTKRNKIMAEWMQHSYQAGYAAGSKTNQST